MNMLRNFQRDDDFYQHVEIEYPFAWAAGRQNTVGLEINLGGLREFWHKPHYPDGIGHLTIYDGSSRHEALSVLDHLLEYKWRSKMAVTRIRPLESKSSFGENLFASMSELHSFYDFLTMGKFPGLASVTNLPFDYRFEIFKYLIDANSNHNAMRELSTGINLVRVA